MGTKYTGVSYLTDIDAIKIGDIGVYSAIFQSVLREFKVDLLNAAPVVKEQMHTISGRRYRELVHRGFII